MTAGTGSRTADSSPAAVLASRDESVAAGALAAAEAAIRDPRRGAGRAEGALAAIAAVVYRRPGLPGTGTVRLMQSLMGGGRLPDRTYRLAGEVFRSLLTGPAGQDACQALVELLAMKDRPAAVYEAAAEGLQFAAAWVPERVDVDSVVALLAEEHLRDYRGRLASMVIERCLYRAGDALPMATFDGFQEQCGGDDFFRYFCFHVAERQDSAPAIRERAKAFQNGRFAWRQQAQAVLGDGRKRVLVVQNIRDGQGDEIIRAASVMQALLDFNPRLEISLVTGRAYLYSHPRVTAIPVDDRPRIEELLREPCDAVIDYFERSVTAVNHDSDLEAEIKAYIERVRPRLVLRSSKGRNFFVYEQFDLDGRPLAQELGLERQRVENVYETTGRLIAELGLPLRAGEGMPRSEPVLTGIPSAEAEAVWAGLTGGNTAGRPVAIVNPFGGVEKLKGYSGRDIGALSREIGRLIAEGFYVVLLPNGAAWSAPELLAEAIERLAPAERAHAVAAPDRSREGDLFLRFIRYADLTVTVEGWAVHVAYCLGKAYRILMLPYSHDMVWHPYLATRKQRVIADPLECEPEDDGPPLPQQPQRFTLLLVLRELAWSRDPEAMPLLRRALASEDREIRLAAAVSLEKLAAMKPAEWMRLLDDHWYRVRAAAAAALGRMPLNGLPVRRDHLAAYWKIGEEPRDWMQILRMGDAARPALEASLDDDDPVIGREAFQMLRLLEMKAEWQPGRTGLRDRVARLLRPRRAAEAPHKAPGGAGPAGQTILILTPVKDACGSIDHYCRRLGSLTYPHARISLGFLESDSRDSSFADLERYLPHLRGQFRRVGLWKKDFGYRLPEGVHRGAEEIQTERRTILARSRNHLLFHALDDEEWALWMDVDVIDYPPDIIERLLAAGKDIVQPHCVLEYGGPSFDRNAWRDHGRLHLDDLRSEGELVELDAVGGTMLLVRADLHRDGLLFPAFPYGKANPLIRSDSPALETEGLGIMAKDLGHRCWGMPRLEIRHRRW